MRKAIALNDFGNLSDAKLAARADSVSKGMTGNAYFPNPSVILKDLDDQTAAFNAAIPAKGTNSPELAAIKNNLKATVVSTLTSLCAYVNSIALGDRVILLTSGFNISSDVPTPTDVTKPEQVSVSRGAFDGTAVASCKSQKAAVLYEAQCRTGEGEFGKAFNSTKSNGITCSGLTPGLVYEFQVRACGRNDKKSEWSNGVMMRV